MVALLVFHLDRSKAFVVERGPADILCSFQSDPHNALPTIKSQVYICGRKYVYVVRAVRFVRCSAETVVIVVTICERVIKIGVLLQATI